MTANAFMAGSLVPPLCVVSIGKTARMHDLLKVGGNYSVSVLGKEQVYLASHFAGRPTLGLQPEFDNLDDRPTLARAVATIATDIVETADCGDHTLFIGRIVRMRLKDVQPLLFYGGRYATLSGTAKIEEIEPPGFW